MRRTRLEKRNILWLISGLIVFTAVSIYTNMIPPESLLTIVLFFVLTGVAVFFIFRYIFNQPRTALLLSSGITLYLILRVANLRHWLYLSLITAFIISLEFYFRNKKNV